MVFKLHQLIVFVVIILVAAYFSYPNQEKLGMIYFMSYDYDKAYQIFTKTLKDKKSSLTSLKKIRDFYLINGDILKALKIQNDLVALRPKNIDYIDKLSELYDWNNLPLKKMKTQELKIDLLTGTKREKFINDLANAYRWRKMYDDANRLYKKIENSKDPSLLINQTYYYLFTKQENYAIKLLTRLTELEIIPDKLRSTLAQLLYYKKLYKLALMQYLVLYGGEVNYKNLYGNPVFLKNRDYVKEKSIYLEKIIALHEVLNEYEILIDIHFELIRLFPRKIYFRFDLIKYYRILSQKDNVLEELNNIKNLVRNRSDEEKHLLDVAGIYNEYGENQHFISIYKRLIVLNSDGLEYYIDLSTKYRELSLNKEALSVLYKMLEIIETSENSKGKGNSSKNKNTDNIMLKKKDGIKVLSYRDQINMKSSSAFDIVRDRIAKERAQKKKKKKLSVLDYKLMALIEVGEIHESLGQSQKAIEAYEKSLEIDSKNLNVIRSLVRNYASERNIEKTLYYYQFLLKNDPSDTEFRLEYAEILSQLGRYEESNKEVLDYLSYHKENDKTLKLNGYNYAGLGEKEKAIIFFRKVFKKNPLDKDALIYLAEEDFNVNRWKDSYAKLHDIKKHYEKNEIPLFLTGLEEEVTFHLDLDRHEKFCQSIISKFEKKVLESKIDKGREHYQLIKRCYLRLKDKGEEERFVLDYLNSFPRAHDVRTDLIYFYTDNADYDLAFKHLEILKKSEAYTKVNQNQEESIRDIIWELGTKYTFPVEFGMNYFLYSNYSYYNMWTEANFKKRNSYIFGVKINQFSSLSGPSLSFQYIQPKSSLFVADTGVVNMGYNFYLGGKNTVNAPFFINYGYWGINDFYGSITYNNALALYENNRFAVEQMEEKKMELFFSYTKELKREVEWGGKLSEYLLVKNANEFRASSLSFNVNYFEYQEKVFKSYYGLYLGYSSSSHTNVQFDELLLKRSLNYFLQAKKKYTLQKEKEKLYTLTLQLRVGGDLYRDLGMGKIINVSIRNSYNINKRLNIKFNMELGRESNIFSSDNSLNSDILINYFF